MSQVYVNGPATIFVGTSSLVTNTLNGVTMAGLEYLGTSENGVVLDFVAYHDDVLNDWSGPHVPFEVLSQAAEATAHATLNVYNHLIYRKVVGRANLLGLTEGVIGPRDVAAALRAERSAGPTNYGAFRLLINSPYATKAFQAATTDACYNFYAAYLAGGARMDLGTRAKRVHCVFRCIPNWVTSGGDSYLFDHDSTGIVATN